ncbi:MAG: hypothetical protein ACP5IV_08130, partial [Caldisericia bacterium]
VKHHPLVNELLNLYNNLKFINPNNTLDLTPIPARITDYLVKNYNLKLDNTYQILKNDVHLYPYDYFCPRNITGIYLTKNTYTIHYFAGSWLPLKTRFTKFLKESLAKIIGANNYYKVKNFKDKILSYFIKNIKYE